MSENPFQAPQVTPTQDGEGVAPLAKKGPVSIIVFGVLNIVFAIIDICVLAGTIVLLADVEIAVPWIVPVIERIYQHSVGGPLLMINIGLGSLVSILLLVAGILLLMNRRMGRTFSNAYGIYTILRPACVVVAFVLWPQFREIPDQDGMPFDMISVVWFSMIYPMIYPVLLLIFINRPRVKAALH